jgi:hypothetical protein
MLAILATTDVYFLQEISCEVWLGIAFYRALVEFPHLSKIGHFTFMTVTERPDDSVYLYDICPNSYVRFP